MFITNVDTKIKILYELSVELEDLFNNFIKLIREHNKTSTKKIPETVVKVIYGNEFYEMKNTAFHSKSDKLSFKKIIELINTRVANLYFGNTDSYKKQKNTIDGHFLTIKGELDSADDLLQKFIMINIKQNNGNLITFQEEKNNNFLISVFQNGEELLELSDKKSTCEKIYNDYKANLFILPTKRIGLKTQVAKNEKMILASDVLVSTVFAKIFEYGSDLKIRESQNYLNLEYILHEQKLSEILLENLNLHEIEAYVEQNHLMHEEIEKLRMENYNQIMDFKFKDSNKLSYTPMVNIHILYDKLNGKEVTIDIIEKNEDVILNLYYNK